MGGACTVTAKQPVPSSPVYLSRKGPSGESGSFLAIQENCRLNRLSCLQRLVICPDLAVYMLINKSFQETKGGEHSRSPTPSLERRTGLCHSPYYQGSYTKLPRARLACPEPIHWKLQCFVTDPCLLCQ